MGAETWDCSHIIEVAADVQNVAAAEQKSKLVLVDQKEILYLAKELSSYLKEGRELLLADAVDNSLTAQCTSPVDTIVFLHSSLQQPELDYKNADSRLLNISQRVIKIIKFCKASKAKNLVIIEYGDRSLGQETNIENGTCLSFFQSYFYESTLKINMFSANYHVQLQKVARIVLQSMAQDTRYDHLLITSDGRAFRPTLRPFNLKKQEFKQDHFLNETILITGGAKGISFACAKKIAETSIHANLVLIGKSLESDAEVSKNLHDLRRITKHASYYSCDISDFQSTNAMVQDVYMKYGKVSWVVHGANAARLSLADFLSVNTVHRDLKTKVLGQVNLFSTLKCDTLKGFIVFNSISNVMGMPGSSHYALAGEISERHLWHMKNKLPKLLVKSINWGAWSEIGAAARVNSKDQLSKRGYQLDQLTPEDGCNAFIDVGFTAASPDRTVVTGKVAGFEIWNHLTKNFGQ